jgi:hypothetical protein
MEGVLAGRHAAASVDLAAVRVVRGAATGPHVAASFEGALRSRRLRPGYAIRIVREATQ